MIASFREREIVWGLKITTHYHSSTTHTSGPCKPWPVWRRLKLFYSEGVGLEFVIYSNECLLCSEGVAWICDSNE